MKTISIVLSSLLISCVPKDDSRVKTLENEVFLLQSKLDSIEVARSTPSRYLKPEYEKYRHYLTDDEIRDLRDSDINHIYSTKGQGRKPVYSKQTEFENRADEYIEENIDEIMDKYGD